MVVDRRSFIAGMLGLLLPPFLLYFDDSGILGNVTGFIGFGLLFAIGWIETTTPIFGKKSEILFKIFDPNWYLSPEKIINSFQDLQYSVNWFLLNFYGDGKNGAVNNSVEGFLMALALMTVLAAITLSIVNKHDGAMAAYFLTMLLETAAILNYYSNNGFYDGLIPFGVISFLMAIYFEWRARS